MEREYRLLHKKDGSYVLQMKMLAISEDNEGHREYSYYWIDIPTEEE